MCRGTLRNSLAALEEEKTHDLREGILPPGQEEAENREHERGLSGLNWTPMYTILLGFMFPLQVTPERERSDEHKHKGRLGPGSREGRGGPTSTDCTGGSDWDSSAIVSTRKKRNEK